MGKDEIRILKAFPIYDDSRRTGTVAVWCPHCEKWHTHGDSEDLTARGRSHRAAHCVSQDSPFWWSGYYLRRISQREARSFGIPVSPSKLQLSARQRERRRERNRRSGQR
jgi:hypothetical protein